MTVDEYVYFALDWRACSVVLAQHWAHRKGLGQHAAWDRKWRTAIGTLRRS